MKTFPVLCTLLALTACGDRTDPSHSHDHDHSHDEAIDVRKGPHGGRLLQDHDIAVEVAIAEAGTPPEFHVYVSKNGKVLPPAAVKLTIELSRLGGKVDRFFFSPENDYLKGNGIVHEPHSFDVKVSAEIDGKRHAWAYDAYEGRTVIAATMANAAGITTAVASPGNLKETLTLHGTIAPNAERVRAVAARFPGPIRSVTKQIGDVVKPGETLAVVESNESLQTYAVTAPIAGVITQRRANPGEAASSDPLFVVSDFASVWAELSFFARDRARIRIGQSVRIASADGHLLGNGTIAAIVPAGSAQTLTARVALDNADARWTPGLFVDGTITLGESQAALLVANSALQTFRDFDVVFAQVGDTYEVRMLKLGRSNGEMTEVLEGLDPGTVYVAGNSYLIKADIEKSGASHDH